MRAANKKNGGYFSTGPMDFRAIIGSPPQKPVCRICAKSYYKCECGPYRNQSPSVCQGMYQNVPCYTPVKSPTRTLVCKQPAPCAVLQEEYEPPDYLCLSILSCLTFCCPIGVCAIMYSCASRDAKKEGDFRAAAKFSEKAKQFVIAGIICGTILIIINIIIIISTPRQCLVGNSC